MVVSRTSGVYGVVVSQGGDTLCDGDGVGGTLQRNDLNLSEVYGVVVS
jgi:hypothetical protein